MIDFESIEKEFSFPLDNLEKKIAYLYYVKRYSIRQVCKELRCANTTVKKALNNTFGVRSTKESLAFRSTDEYRESLSLSQLGESNNQAKLTPEAVLAIRDEYEIALKEGAQKTATQVALAK